MLHETNRDDDPLIDKRGALFSFRQRKNKGKNGFPTVLVPQHRGKPDILPIEHPGPEVTFSQIEEESRRTLDLWTTAPRGREILGQRILDTAFQYLRLLERNLFHTYFDILLAEEEISIREIYSVSMHKKICVPCKFVEERFNW